MDKNYFELFELPVSLQPDKAQVRKAYMALSKQHHPDFFVNRDAAQQDNALEMSALLNKAFRTLNNRDETIAYVLRLKGLLEEEEKYNLEPEFLMEMMEVNEALADALMESDATAKEQLYARLRELDQDLFAPVKEIVENYREGSTTNEDLLRVKDYYFKKKYLLRLSGQLGRML